MATRTLPILALAALAAMGSSVCALAESKSEAAVKAPVPTLTNPAIRPELTLRCRPQLGSSQILCSETVPAPAVKRLIHPDAAFATSFSLHTANNLATRETTTKFLRGVTGNTSLAQKVTPTFMRISKSMPARYGLAVAVLGTGAVAVYERLSGEDDKTTTKPAEGGLTYVFVGEIKPNGNFRKEAPDKKP